MNSQRIIEVGVIALIFAAVALLGFQGGTLQRVPFLGSVGQTPSYYAAVNTSTICSSISSLLDVTNTARMTFKVSNHGAFVPTICQAATCTLTAGGITVGVSSTGASFFEQSDSYTGPYSCVAAASTTVGLTK